MGGKKKRSMKQMTKQPKKKPSKKPRATPPPTEKKSIPGITTPNPKSDKVKDSIKKMKVITPYAVATKFNVRISIARTLLEDLERQGTIEFVSKSRNLKIYKPAD